MESGRPDKAVREVREAVAIFRELDAASPGRYQYHLAGALLNLGGVLRDLGHSTEALPLVQEAKEILDVLAAASPDRYRSNLAAAAECLSILFSSWAQRSCATSRGGGGDSPGAGRSLSGSVRCPPGQVP